jgi:hypothetical protein
VLGKKLRTPVHIDVVAARLTRRFGSGGCHHEPLFELDLPRFRGQFSVFVS